MRNTCGSVNFTPGRDASPVRSCSMYSKTRYKLEDVREVTNPSNFIIFGWSSLRKIRISLAINLTLSRSKLSNRTLLRATNFLFSTSRALYTLLYVPWPICKNNMSGTKTPTKIERATYNDIDFHII